MSYDDWLLSGPGGPDDEVMEPDEDVCPGCGGTLGRDGKLCSDCAAEFGGGD